MILENLSLTNFRNHSRAEIHAFNRRSNFIYGLNAQGKSNLLEAIYLLCLGRSFRSSKNEELLQHGSDAFKVEGRFLLNTGLKKHVILYHERDRKKEISINRKRLSRHAELFGQFPVVILSPEDYRITTGGPAERRKFVDMLLSQISLSYLANLQEYARILKQRNRILQAIREGERVEEGAIAPWTENLITVGSRILAQRAQFIDEFSKIIFPIYKWFSESHEELRIVMVSGVGSGDQSWEDRFAKCVARVHPKERRQGMTLVGPHRDDFVFEINGFDLKTYGSRGEHKSVLISTKIAEWNFIRQKIEEQPIFLLDDFFSELDRQRERRVLDALHELGQLFLTSPTEKALPGLEHATFYVEAGEVYGKEDA